MSLATSWEAAANPRRRVGRAVEFHPVIGSTNDRARALLEARSDDGVAVVADLQTAGRGRLGRTWLSPAGTNLMVSVGAELGIPARDAWRVGAATVLAAIRACEPWARLAVKWPNDLFAADGRKVGGVLIETTLQGERLSSVVIGVGINVNWHSGTMPQEISASAVSLAELAGSSVDRVALLSRYLAALDEELAAVDAGTSPVDRLRDVSWLDGRWLRVDTGGEHIEGRGLGLSDQAELLVETETGVVAIGFGEVVQVRATAEAVA